MSDREDTSEIRLVGCFGFNGPLRQYFGLYRPSPRERKKEKRNDQREQKCPNNPHPDLH